MSLTLAQDDRDVLTPEDFAERLESGAAQLWRGERSAIMLQRTEYHRSGEVVMEAGPASGDMDEILAAVPRLEDWAREIGCTQVHVHAGRKGWERALREQGYEVHQVILRKLL